jgi:uncharacterized protein (DUF362 family)
MASVEPFLTALADLAHTRGGWGYAPDQSAHPEPTCLALLALAQEPQRHHAVIDRGKAALAKCLAPDGTYRLPGGREEATWPTALVLFVQAVLDFSRDQVAHTAAALLALRGRLPEGGQQDVHDIDLKIVGWPWARANFSWAEPTAWACLALRRAGLGQSPRVQEGLRLLLDRASDEGGINYGNRRILGRATEPIPGPTALMLLALQGHGDHPRVAAAARYLGRHALGSTDLEHLCWAKLALDLHADLSDVADTLAVLDEQIRLSYEERAATPWLRPSPLRAALTALALAPDNAFRLPQAPPLPEPPEPPTWAPRKGLSDRLRSTFQNLAVNAMSRLRQPQAPAQVHIARATSYDDDLAAILQAQYEHFRQRVPLAGKRVVLKPNLVEYLRDKVINTNPRVVAAVIELCRREGAREVVVAEGPGHCRNAEYLVAASGLGEVLAQHSVPFVDINHDEPVKLPNLGRLTGLEHLHMARTVATADVLISLPKLKTHHWAGATLSLKNLFGTLPGVCYGWPKNELHWRGIDNSIVDIALTRGPDLAIVDGVVGMEGDGPLNGTPKPLGALVLGADPVAVDATCCRLMGLQPERIAYLAMAHQKKLGVLRAEEIVQLGDSVASLAQPFAVVPHLAHLQSTPPPMETAPAAACPGAREA